MKPYFFGDPSSDTILIQMVDDHDLQLMPQEVSHIKRLSDRDDFLLVAVKTENWNHDLTPWTAPPVRGAEGFGDGAGATLSYLTGVLIPSLSGDVPGNGSAPVTASDQTDSYSLPPHEKSAPGIAEKHPRRKTYLIGGYSLAGLFALWAVCQTDLFSGAACASPSVWFPHFTEYMKDAAPRADAVYLSLGDREEKTRNRTMAQVGDAIRRICADLSALDVACTLEWNPGNHFRDPDLRTAKAFAWVMEHCCSFS